MASIPGRSSRPHPPHRSRIGCGRCADSSTCCTPDWSSWRPRPRPPGRGTAAGIRSLAHWLTWQGGIAPGRAHDVVRLAEARTTHPATMAVFAEGGLSVDQVAIATKAPAYLDDHFAEVAPLATVAQLRIMMRAARPAPPKPVARARARRSRPTSTTTVGTASRASSTPTTAASSTPRSPRPATPCSTTATPRCRGPTPSSRWPSDRWTPPPRPAVSGSGSPGSWTRRTPSRPAGSTASPSPTGCASTCRATDHQPHVHRRRPAGQRRAHASGTSPSAPAGWCSTATRSAGCPGAPRPAGCRSTTSTTAPTAGPDDTPNLVALCPADHRLHHQGRLGITGDADDPDGLTFTDARGDVIDPAARPTPPTRPPPRPKVPYEHPLGERMQHWSIMYPDPPRTPRPPRRLRTLTSPQVAVEHDEVVAERHRPAVVVGGHRPRPARRRDRPSVTRWRCPQ